ncbi:hypothetical protein LCGC14_2926410, partial [marine sediment metagenome]
MRDPDTGPDSAPSDGAVLPEMPETPAEREARKLIKRQRRNLRKAEAEGFMAGICAMLRPGDLALDCGANMGVVTTQLARSGADVIAYEPDPFAFSHLDDRFSCHDTVTLVNAALGTHEGTVQLMRAENFEANPEGASVKSTILDGGRAIDQASAIDVTLLDFPALVAQLVAERGEIAFVKMDIEGAEGVVLRDSAQLIASYKPVMVIESATTSEYNEVAA